jgi:hypothetical protein
MATAIVNITDRAKRYRAQDAIKQRDRICVFCSSLARPLMVGHVNGNESDGEPANLVFTCRSCNATIGIFMARAGFGKRTAQYNPDGGARSVGQWIMAVTSMKSAGPMKLADAVEMVRATSPAKRSEYAREIWRTRRAHGTDKTGVPF